MTYSGGFLRSPGPQGKATPTCVKSLWRSVHMMKTADNSAEASLNSYATGKDFVAYVAGLLWCKVLRLYKYGGNYAWFQGLR
eukprot:3718174-Prorocentrum_lima.AAC.1